MHFASKSAALPYQICESKYGSGRWRRLVIQLWGQRLPKKKSIWCVMDGVTVHHTPFILTSSLVNPEAIDFELWSSGYIFLSEARFSDILDEYNQLLYAHPERNRHGSDTSQD